MSKSGPAVLLTIAVALIVPSGAQAAPVKQYVLKHPKHEHCRAHYVRKVEYVKRREHGHVVEVHGHVVKIRETVCVYVAPKKAVAAPPTVAPAHAVHLHAHVDPSFTQSPADPLIVTYSYSASAEQESNGVSEPIPSLPSGVLAFYSDGLLACSINVGGAITGGECAVDYSHFGQHSINAIYSSGEASATTGSETVAIEPPPIIPTTTTESVSGGACAVEEVTPSGGGPMVSARACTFTVTMDVAGQVPPPSSGVYKMLLTAEGHLIGGIDGAADCVVETMQELPTVDQRWEEGYGEDLSVWVRSANCSHSSPSEIGIPEPWSVSKTELTAYLEIPWTVLSKFGGATAPSFPNGWGASQSEPAPL